MYSVGYLRANNTKAIWFKTILGDIYKCMYATDVVVLVHYKQVSLLKRHCSFEHS